MGSPKSCRQILTHEAAERQLLVDTDRVPSKQINKPFAPSQVSPHDLHEVLQTSMKGGHINYPAIAAPTGALAHT